MKTARHEGGPQNGNSEIQNTNYTNSATGPQAARPDGSRFGKADKTGRSTGKLPGKRKALKPPKGEPWVWHTRELLCSDAWQAQSLLCRRFIDFLKIEQMNHAGTMNGQLMATYDQLQKAGIARKKIKSVIEEAKALGLVRVDEGGPWWRGHKPNLFLLTYFPSGKDKDIPAENRWKTPNLEAAMKAVKSRSETRSKTYLGTRRGVLLLYLHRDPSQNRRRPLPPSRAARSRGAPRSSARCRWTRATSTSSPRP